MLKFINNHINDRTFQVKSKNTLSDQFSNQNGVVQGSSISVTLFLIAINEITTQVPPPTTIKLFADDAMIFCKGKNVNSIKNQIQLTLDNLSKWSLETGFSFSPNKTKCILFTRQREIIKPKIKFENTTLDYSDNVKILGLTFDKKLNWCQHIRQLKIRTQKSMKILKTLSHTEWGADADSLIKIYKSIIRSKIDYGSIVYGAANHRTIQMLNTIQNSAIRLSLGAFKSSPVASILCIAGEPPLSLRRKLLETKYIIKIAKHQENPVYNKIIKKSNQVQPANISHLRPLYERQQVFIKQNESVVNNIIQSTELNVPPWQFNRDKNIDLSLSSHNKNTTDKNTYKSLHYELLQSYAEHEHIYTDASKIEQKTGLAVISNDKIIQLKTSNLCTIFTVEALAILTAIQSIHYTNDKKFLIMSDSLSTLISINNLNTSRPIISQIINELHVRKNNVCLAWIPGHVGIIGNEKADLKAKETTGTSFFSMCPHITDHDFQNSIKLNYMDEWQNLWSKCSDNKLREIKQSILPWPKPYEMSRRDEVIFVRLRIGHTLITHGHLMAKEDPPSCSTCGTLITVKHILLECRQFNEIRIEQELPESLYEILSPTPETSKKLIKFINNTELRHRI